MVVLKGGVAHEVRNLEIIILAEDCVYSAFATNRTTVFLLKFLHVDHMIGSNDEDMGAYGWILMADFKLQLPYRASQVQAWAWKGAVGQVAHRSN